VSDSERVNDSAALRVAIDIETLAVSISIATGSAAVVETDLYADES